MAAQLRKKMTHGARYLVRTAMLLFPLGIVACSPSQTNGTPPPSATGNTTASPSTLGTATPSPIPATPNPTDGWLSFHSTAGKLSFRYDPTWRPVQCPPSDSPLIVLGQNVCGQIEPTFEIDSVSSTQAPKAPDLRCDASQPPASSSSITIDGVTGTREYIDYTTPAYRDCRQPITHAVAYTFYTARRAYTIMYLYIPSGGADQTTNVDRMVQTLTFSA
jgi:hypothetical protein